MIKRFLIVSLAVAAVGCGDKVSSIEEFNSLVKKVQKKNEEIGNINKDIMDAVRQFNANRKADERIVLPDSMLGLDKDQLKKVQEMIEKEQDLTYRGLLTQIVEKDRQILKMTSDLEDLKDRLPKPHVVKAGDSHHKIAFDWLTKEKNVPKEKAFKLLEETALIDEVRDGFNIWLYYDDQEEVFGTFVTQGTAKISPNQFKYGIRKMQLDAARASGKEDALKEIGDSASKP